MTVAHASRLERLLSEFATWGYDTRGWSPATRQKYVWLARALDTWLHENRGKSALWANEKDLQAWLFSTPANATTRNNYRQAAVAFYAFLCDSEYIDRNVALNLPRLPQAAPLPKALTAAQARAVEQAAKLHPLVVRVLVLVYLYVALRNTEALSLEWRHLDLEDGWVRFTGKGNKQRALPLPLPVAVALRKWRADCPDPRWVFPSDYGQVPGRRLSQTWVRNVIREVGRDAGLGDLHPHQLRHTPARRGCSRRVWTSGRSKSCSVMSRFRRRSATCASVPLDYGKRWTHSTTNRTTNLTEASAIESFEERSCEVLPSRRGNVAVDARGDRIEVKRIGFPLRSSTNREPTA